ncbi:MAG: hypothetical protein ABR548_03910 [Actinomycetota bacterium]
MFGTLSRVKVKSGSESALDALDKEWMETMRPKIAGPVYWFRGTQDGHPETTVTIFLCQDKKTYFDLADDPAQDAFFKRMLEHFEGEPSWEDVQFDVLIQD